MKISILHGFERQVHLRHSIAVHPIHPTAAVPSTQMMTTKYGLLALTTSIEKRKMKFSFYFHSHLNQFLRF